MSVLRTFGNIAVRRNFSRGAKLTFCLSFSGCWQCNVNGSSQNALPCPLYSTKKCLMLRQQKNCVWLAPKRLFHSCFFSHSIKLRGLPLPVVYVLLHYLPNMSVFNRHMRKNAYTTVSWRETFKIRCHVIVTQSTPSVEKSACKAVRTGHEWTAQLITAWHQISERDSCVVWVSYQRSLQDLDQYIGIKLLTSF